MKMHLDKKQGLGFYLSCLVFAIPTIFFIIIGLGLVWFALTIYMLVALLLAIVIPFILVAITIFRGLKSRNPKRHVPSGDTDPSWIRFNDIFAIFMILDISIIGLFFWSARFSQYSQTVALYLMALFFPMCYLTATIFGDSFIDLLYKEYQYNVAKPNVVLWVSSSIAKTLLKLQRENGVKFLRKALVAARQLYEQSGRTAESLDETIGLLDFMWTTGIEADYGVLLSFTTEVFGHDQFHLERLPKQCKKLVSSFDWFSDSKHIEEGKREKTFFQKSIEYSKVLFGGAGVIGALYALIQLIGIHPSSDTLKTIGSMLQPVELTIVLTILAVLVLISPLLRLKALLSVAVNLSDLEAYEKDYARSELMGADSGLPVPEKPAEVKQNVVQTSSDNVEAKINNSPETTSGKLQFGTRCSMSVDSSS